jgi:methyltransferase (TIGR00027 family)
MESERPDAHFHDPYARKLAGARGERIMATLPHSMRNAAWSVVARTWQFDHYIRQQVAGGTTLVVNLAAGLDTRPYRLDLPADLLWVEVDQPALLEEKAALLADATPRCRLERVALDLTLDAPRRALFEQLSRRSERALILTEGLIMYLSESEAIGLTQELARYPAFQTWITDLISPRLLEMIDRDWGNALRAGGAPMRFAPPNGPAFFSGQGWKVVASHSTFSVAAQLKRLPWLMSLFAWLPGTDQFHARRPWAATCVLTRPGN